MARKSRIDAPGAIHHIIVRGIERKAIFKDEEDNENFLNRFGKVLTETSTPCYAWCMMTNHAHLLLKTGEEPISTVMRRLLTGYAQQFNRRHERHGHLFQNRYKSFLCEEDVYLLELVRYIHLNPLRAKLVQDIEELAEYPVCGHAALMGKNINLWQDTKYVLSFFGKTVRSARNLYCEFVQKGILQGTRPDLDGGGLIRSVGGWSELKVLQKQESRIMSDERILGCSDFVEQVLNASNEAYEKKAILRYRGITIERLLDKLAEYFNLETEEIKSVTKERNIARVRSVFCYLANKFLGYSQAQLAKELCISPSTVSKAVIRGRKDDSIVEIKENLLRQC